MAKMMRRRKPDVHVKALESIVSANTFFTVAVLIGITGTITPSSSISPNCVAGDDIARDFFLFEIVSFSCYLLSSLVAQGMKLAITLLVTDDVWDEDVIKSLPSYDCRSPYDFCSSYDLLPYYGFEPMQSSLRAEKLPERRKYVLKYAPFMMLLAACFTIVGTFFLMLSMVDAIQLKLGLLCCGIPFAVIATFVLAGLVVVGLLIYSYTFVYASMHYLPE